jgi:predicted Zn-dependent protease
VFLALVLSLIPAVVWAETNDACGPAPAVKAALDQLPQKTPAETEWQFYGRRLAALQALLRQYPDDVFVQQAYLRWGRTVARKDELISEYKARHEQNPASAQLAYLYGLTLVGRQTPEAIKL